MPNPERQAIGRLGGLLSWANTPDRTARTATARKNGPGTVDYWLARQDPERFANATDRQRVQAAEAARKAHYAAMALKSAQVRRRRAGGAADVAS